MKLAIADMQTFFSEDRFNVLTIENVAAFRKMCEDAKRAVGGEDSGFVLSDGDRILNAAKIGLFVSDPLSVDLSDKKFTSRLITELSALAEEKYGAEVERIVAEFSDLFGKLNSDSSVMIDWFDESPISALFKAFGVTVKRDSADIAERLYNYLSAAIELCGVRAVFFVGLLSWLTESERSEIYKLLKYHGVLALSIERFALPKTDGEFSVVIDNDLCEIVV